MIPQLSAVRYAVRSTIHISNINTLKSIYYAYHHSVIKYGYFFTLQKKGVRITAGVQPRISCRSLFKQLDILLVLCQ